MKGFYTSVIMFVIPQQRTDSDPPQDLCFFTDIPTGRNSVISFFLSFFYFLFFIFLSPKHCDCACERLHPILYLCNVEPCSACRGSAWRWWWISVQSHQTCSGSVGDVSIHPMDVLPKPSRLRFRVIQNVVLMPPPHLSL